MPPQRQSPRSYAYVESIEKLTKMGYQADELEQNRKNGLDKMVVNSARDGNAAHLFERLLPRVDRDAVDAAIKDGERERTSNRSRN
jgi:hypothetical protein